MRWHSVDKPCEPQTRRGIRMVTWRWLFAATVLGVLGPVSATVGVSPSTVTIGTVLDLKGDSRGLGQGMKVGIEAALQGQTVKGKSIELVALNDNYSPPRTVEATEQLLAEGIFAMVGNVGTPTAKVSLPILAEHSVPAVGFFTGAGLLRPGIGDILNFRASYVQETAKVIESALAAGVKAREICAYVQNDAYGMAGVAGIKRALAKYPEMSDVLRTLDVMMAMDEARPARNNLGPVGVYRRNTLTVRDGYQSLKSWEINANTKCKVVVSVGTYGAIARFIGYSRAKGDDWIVSAVSFTGADNFRQALHEYSVGEGVVMTQVVPPLDSDLPIVKEARRALGNDFGYVSLEGYIVGRLFLQIVRKVDGPLTRESFLQAATGQVFELDGMVMDFSTDNQGSDFVLLTYLDGDRGYKPMSTIDWAALLQ